MDTSLFTNPYMLMRYGEEHKTLIGRPPLYQDAIGRARKLILGVKGISGERIRLLVHHPDMGLVIVKDDVWPDFYKWVGEVVIESDREPNLHEEEPDVVPAGRALTNKHKRERPFKIVRPSLPSSPSPSAHRASSTISYSPSPPPAPDPRRAPPSASGDHTDHVNDMVSIKMHTPLVQKWLAANRGYPWVVPPAHLHSVLRAYLARPLRERDDALLPTDPQVRLHLRTRSFHRPRPFNSYKRNFLRAYISDDGRALWAALCRVHGDGTHRDAYHTRYLLYFHYVFSPSDSFVEYWCAACPGCRAGARAT